MNWGGDHSSLLPGDRCTACWTNMRYRVSPPEGLCVDPEGPLGRSLWLSLDRVHVSALPLTSCVTWHFTNQCSRFLIRKIRIINSASFLGLLGGS